MKISTKLNIEFDTLFNEYRSYVFKIIINESKGKMTNEDIEETVSDVFFLLWQNNNKIKDVSKIKSYIGRIAKNTTLNKLRSKKDNILLNDNIYKSHNISYENKEKIELIHESLNNMSDIDREIFTLFYFNNKKLKEIAIIKSMENSAIKVRLHRIRKKLRKILKNGGY